MKKKTTKSEPTAPARKPVQTTRHLRHEFDNTEKLENAKQLAESLMEANRIDADFDRVKQDFKARLSTVEAKTGSLRDKVSSGYEMRETKCEWRFDDPKAGKKSLWRLDVDELVETTDMNEADKQTELPLADPEIDAAKANRQPFGTPVAEAMEKATKTSHSGVVACEADGDDISDPDDNKNGLS